MTRYEDSCAESLERVMRFISVRNWSSVGVAMMFLAMGFLMTRPVVECVFV